MVERPLQRFAVGLAEAVVTAVERIEWPLEDRGAGPIQPAPPEQHQLAAHGFDPLEQPERKPPERVQPPAQRYPEPSRARARAQRRWAERLTRLSGAEAG